MAKNYQDMSLEELRVHLENKILEKIFVEQCKSNLLEEKNISFKGNDLPPNAARDQHRANIIRSIKVIKWDVEDNYIKRKKKSAIFSELLKNFRSNEILEENQKNIVSALDSILKMVEDLFENNEDAELFDSDIKIKVHNFFDWGTPTWGTPISMEPFYKAIRRYQIVYPDIVKKLEDLEKWKNDYNQKVESIENELKRLELEYYAIKLAMLRKEQCLESVIVSETFENFSKLFVGLFNPNTQTQEEEATLSRDLASVSITRDGGED